MTAAEIASDIRTIAAACQAAGVTHLRLRSGPVREMVVLPAPPSDEGADESEEQKKARTEEALYGRKFPGEGKNKGADDGIG